MFINYKYLCSTDSTQSVFERSVLPSSTDPQLHEKWYSGSDTVREVHRILDGAGCVNDCSCLCRQTFSKKISEVCTSGRYL